MRKSLTVVCIIFVLLALFITSSLILNVKGVNIRSGEVRSYINGVFSFGESIIVEGNATLIIENATLEFVQRKDYEYGIILLGSAEGYPTLLAKNVTLRSSRGILISISYCLAEIYSLRFDGAGKSKGQVRLYGDAYLRAASSNIPYFYCYGSSRLNLINSVVNYLNVYENASGIIDGCTVYSVKVYDFGSANISLSDVRSSIFAEGFATASVEASSVIGRVSSSDNSTVKIIKSKVYQMEVTASEHGRVTLENTTSLVSKDPGEIKATGFSTVQLIKCRFSDFIIRVSGNSTLSLMNSSVSGSVFYLSEFSRLNISNSDVDWIVEAFDRSCINAFGSAFNILSFEDSSGLNAVNCKIGRLRCFESSKAFISGSSLRDVSVELVSFNRTLSGFSEGYFDNLSFVAGDLNVTFLRSSVDVGWSFRFLGSSNVSFHDSRLVNLYAGDKSALYLFNTTCVDLDVKDASTVEVWYYLVVRVVDYFGAPVSGVNVSVLLPSPITIFTDGDGRASFRLLERVVNASGEHVSREYIFIVAFDGSLSSYSVELAGSRMVTCSVASPWWYWHMVYGIVIASFVVVAFSLFMVRRKRVKVSKIGVNRFQV